MLRPALIEDAELLVDIRKTAVLAQPEGLWTGTEIEAAANFLTLEKIRGNFTDHEFYIYEDKAFVGFRGNYLAYLFVSPELQGRKIGAVMLEFAERKVSANYPDIWLFAHPYAERFYEKHGYKKQPQTEEPFGVVLYKFVKVFS